MSARTRVRIEDVVESHSHAVWRFRTTRVETYAQHGRGPETRLGLRLQQSIVTEGVRCRIYIQTNAAAVSR